MKTKYSIFLLCFILPFYCYSTEPVKVQLLSTVESVGKDNSVILGLSFDIDPEWKVYAPNDTLSSHLGYPPEIEWNYLKNIQDVQVHWPVAETEQWNGYTSAIYKNRIIVPFTVNLQHPYKPIELDFIVHFLSCNKVCLPVSKHITFTLNAGEATETPQASEIYEAMIPKRLNFVLMIIFAILGGMILNFMPCVLPVLTLKLLSLTNKKSAAHFARSALNIFSGIVFSFLCLALLTLTIREFGTKVGWGFHFQNITFLSLISILMFVFSLNLFGAFEFRLPSFLQENIPLDSNQEEPSYLKDFLSGVLATLLSTPCSAPLLGTAVSYALTMGGIYILVIFLGLGIGFGFPYIIIASVPVEYIPLPRPGPWMVRLRQLLGFGVLVTSFWLGSIAIKHLGVSLPFSTISSGENLSWDPLDSAKIDEKVDQGSIVFIDITADWCMTCMYNSRFVLNKSKLQKMLQHPKIVRMQGDWTKKDEEIYNFLKKNNRYGVPFNKIYGPHCKQGVDLPELLSQNLVIETLEKCGLPPSV